jgi:hypothetical protein
MNLNYPKLIEKIHCSSGLGLRCLAGSARSSRPTWPFSPLSQNRGTEAVATDGGAAADSGESEVQDRWERG